jgi:L-lactate dehydrogenase complex protein LldG
MNARDEILAVLRTKARDVTHPPRWRSRRNFPDLADRFTEALTRVHGEVIRADSLEGALQALDALFEELSARNIVANAEPVLTGLGLETRWPGINWHIVGQSEGDLRAFCAAADVGLSGAEAALAETGSIAISSGPGHSRLATLLPTVHVALVPTSSLTTDIFTWTAARQGGMPSKLVLVSGPSKTADIEQTMAIGVHGPKRFIVVLYQDEAE